MSRRSWPYDKFGIETAFSNRNLDEAVAEGLTTLYRFDEPYFRQFVTEIRTHIASSH